MKNKKGKIVTFSSFKGGIGKTTSILNVAGSLSKNGQKVLLVDLNFISGDLSVLLNSNMKCTIFNVVDDISNNRFRDYKDYVVSINENIELVNSLKDPRQAKDIENHYIEIFLNHVKFKYDFVLVDTVYGFHDSTITSIDMSDENIFVISNDIMCLKSTKTALSIMNDAEVNNVSILLNESAKIDNNSFTNYEIESILKKKINYIIPKNCFVKDINKYVLDGKILTLYEKSNMKDSSYNDISKYLISKKEA